MIRVVPLVVFAAIGTAAAAPSSAPNDFAYGRVVQPNATAVVQRVQVPQDVYERVVRTDLGDLRVYNAAFEEVPYAIRRPAFTEAHTPWSQLPVFALPAPPAGSEDGAQVSIELGDAGTVVAVHGATTNDAPSAGYLVDASGIDQRVDELLIEWSSDVEGFIGKFRVETSDDLDAWHSTVASATLATLETNGRQIIVDKIELPGVRASYLKIGQLEGATPITIERVSFRTNRSQLPDRHWKDLRGTPTDDGYQYDTGGKFPLDRIGLELEQPSFLVTAELYSRDGGEDRWRERGKHTFYRVAVDGMVATSDPVAYTVRDRYWRAELLNDEEASPTLKIGWLPDELIFLMQGNRPFVLAYGQADFTGRQWPMGGLLARLDKDVEIQSVALAGLSEANELGGPVRLEPAPEPIDWETVLLWTVLVIGVGFVGFLAARLLRQNA